ncbi:MAG: hypothetical protein IPP36_13160 [Nitrosomonadales bacterium]|nr:hypothetical protein [Nitrosomonadales bacterium]
MSWTTLWDFAPLNTSASSEIAEIFGNLATFENPKPVDLIRLILRSRIKKTQLLWIFFAGSATTAHAIMALNANDGGKRRFVLVQLPEACNEIREAFKAGYKNIAELSKERIRRAGQKIKSENALTAPDLDIGFRVLKIDSSNMKDVYYAPMRCSKVTCWRRLTTSARTAPRGFVVPGLARLGRGFGVAHYDRKPSPVSKYSSWTAMRWQLASRRALTRNL